MTEILTLDFKEKVEFVVPINLEKTKKLEANEYDMEIVIEFEDVKTKKTESLKYLEKGDISVAKETSGFIVRKNSVTKTNEGKVVITVEIETKKDVTYGIGSVLLLLSEVSKIPI